MSPANCDIKLFIWEHYTIRMLKLLCIPPPTLTKLGGHVWEHFAPAKVISIGSKNY